VVEADGSGPQANGRNDVSGGTYASVERVPQSAAFVTQITGFSRCATGEQSSRSVGDQVVALVRSTDQGGRAQGPWAELVRTKGASPY